MFTHLVGACMYLLLPMFSWFILDTFLIIVPSFIKIQLHLAEIWGFVFDPKLRAYFHTLCMHMRTCTRKNIINQLRRPIQKYTESFVKIWLHLVKIFRCYFYSIFNAVESLWSYSQNWHFQGGVAQLLSWIKKVDTVWHSWDMVSPFTKTLIWHLKKIGCRKL